MYNFDVLLSIATNIAVLLMTASVLQGHICFCYFKLKKNYNNYNNIYMNMGLCTYFISVSYQIQMFNFPLL